MSNIPLTSVFCIRYTSVQVARIIRTFITHIFVYQGAGPDKQSLVQPRV